MQREREQKTYGYENRGSAILKKKKKKKKNLKPYQQRDQSQLLNLPCFLEILLFQDGDLHRHMISPHGLTSRGLFPLASKINILGLWFPATGDFIL